MYGTTVTRLRPSLRKRASLVPAHSQLHGENNEIERHANGKRVWYDPFSVQVRARSTISQSAPYAKNRWLVCRCFLAVCILNQAQSAKPSACHKTLVNR